MDLNDTLVRELGACLDRLAKGDESARGRIIELCSDRLRLLVQRMLQRFPNVKRWEEDDDVFQEAILRLYTSLGKMTLATPRDVMAIAVTQIKRVLLDMARHYGGPMSDAANHASVAGKLHDPVQQAPDRQPLLESWTAFHDAVERLPAEQKEVFHLVWYMGADQATVSQLMGMSTRTVKRYWKEARESVKSALGDEPPEPTVHGR